MENWERVTIREKNSRLFDEKIGKLSSRSALLPPYFDYNETTEEFIFIGFYKKGKP